MQRVDRIESVRRASDVLEDADVNVAKRQLSSLPDEASLALVSDEAIDEIVMGGRKRSAAEKAILGNTTQKIVLNVDVPVTVTGSE